MARIKACSAIRTEMRCISFIATTPGDTLTMKAKFVSTRGSVKTLRRLSAQRIHDIPWSGLMKLPFAMVLAYGVFGLCIAAQAQRSPSLIPAGPNRPSGVPADFVITPFGYFHPSCILQLRKGESVSKEGMLHHADGSETKVNACQYSHFSSSGSPASAQEKSKTNSP